MLTLGEIYEWVVGSPKDHPQDDLWLVDGDGRVYLLGFAGEIVLSAVTVGANDSDYLYAEHNFITGQCMLKFTPIVSPSCIKEYETYDAYMVLRGNPKRVY